MGKHSFCYALGVTILMCGAGIMVPGLVNDAAAYTIDDDGFAVPEGETDALRYGDLREAIKDNKNVRLSSDIVHYINEAKAPSLNIDHSMVLDLNGHVLSTASTSGGTGGNTTIAVVGDGIELTIRDSSDGETGALRYDHKGNASPEMIRVETGAKLILESGNIYTPYGRYGEGIGINLKGSGATFEMKGGKILTHEESAHSMNYGVDANANGSVFKMTGGEIKTTGPALYIPTGRAALVDISGDAVLDATGAKTLDLASTTATGSISGVTVKNISINNGIRLDNITVSGDLEVKGGENTLANLTVLGKTTILSGKITIGEGANLEGGLVYSGSTNGSLSINDGAIINGFEQQFKNINASYTDKDTGEKVKVSYGTCGALNINGGRFSGDFKTVSKDEVKAANDVRSQFVKDYNEHSGKTALVYKDVANVPEIKGGIFATKPADDEIDSTMEAEQDTDGTWKIYSKETNHDGATIRAEEGGDYVEIDGYLLADRKARLMVVDRDLEMFDMSDSTSAEELVLARDYNITDRYANRVFPVSKDDGVTLRVHMVLTPEEYETLDKYEKKSVIYFDENNEKKDELDVELQRRENGSYEAVFTTDHLSTYALAGANVRNDDNTGDDTTATTTSAETPETGTMTASGASATGAAIVTAIVVGILTSVVSFVYLMRRH